MRQTAPDACQETLHLLDRAALSLDDLGELPTGEHVRGRIHGISMMLAASFRPGMLSFCPSATMSPAGRNSLKATTASSDVSSVIGSSMKLTDWCPMR